MTRQADRFQPIRRGFPGRMFAWRSGRAIQDADTGRRPRAVDVVIREAAAPQQIAELLATEVDAPLLLRSRRFLVEGRPVQLARSYYPLELVRGTQITENDTGPGGAYARLAEIGHEPVEFIETVCTRMPSPEEGEQLELPGGTPVFAVLRAAYAAEGRCVEVTEMILDGSAYELEYSSGRP
ncbi:GntR family transcriptional regulator [Glycomyces arizonensis]|uniref:GntR family transcriptional regulator n=1 Tax=Glycomyces arizonensis TaxID=256035 RepID=UPI0004043D8A|nr:UTRA domain-containing protein [Glycomyces arizonensis]